MRLPAKEQSSSISARKSRKEDRERGKGGGEKKENQRERRRKEAEKSIVVRKRNLHFVKLLFESLQTRLKDAWKAKGDGGRPKRKRGKGTAGWRQGIVEW